MMEHNVHEARGHRCSGPGMQPSSTMTNASGADLVSAANGLTLKLHG